MEIREYNRGKERSCASCKEFRYYIVGNYIEFTCAKYDVRIKPIYTCDDNEWADYDVAIDRAYFLADHYHLEER